MMEASSLEDPRNNRLHGLIKFGHKQFMLDLFYNGNVYMNTLENFRRSELDENRKDYYEGLGEWKDITWLKIKNPDTGEEIELSIDGSTGIKLLNPILRQEEKGNIYCMYGITTEWLEKNNCINPMNTGFGNGDPYMVVIHKPKIFLNRVKAELKKLNLWWKYAPVSYCDEVTHQRGSDPFKKSERLSYQCEFRIFAQCNIDQPLCLNIGSIADIASIHPAANLDTLSVDYGDENYQWNPSIVSI